MIKNLLKPRMDKGFTLVEVLISVAILSIIFAGSYAVLLTGQNTWFVGIDTCELQAQLRLGSSYIIREFHEATSFSITPVDTDDDILVFTTPNEASISYYRDISDSNNDGRTDQIIREYPSGTRRVISNNISSLSFSSLGKLLQVNIAASKTSRGRTLQLSLAEKVRGRNE